MPNGAHIHLLLNHIPVMGAVFIAATSAFAFWRKSTDLWKYTYFLALVIGVATLGAYFSGEPAEKVIEHLPGVTEAKIEAHEDLALIGLATTEILAVLGIAALLCIRKTQALPKKINASLLVISLGNLVLMGVVANLGGKIRHTELEGNSPSVEASHSGGGAEK